MSLQVQVASPGGWPDNAVGSQAFVARAEDAIDLDVAQRPASQQVQGGANRRHITTERSVRNLIQPRDP
jgi:hypothetical protein